MSARIVIDANTVRTWARGKGLTVRDHGRLPAEVVTAFNKGRRHTYQPAMVQPQRIVKLNGVKLGADGRKRSIVVQTTTGELRSWANENGFNLGQRGRIPATVVEAFTSRDLVSA